VRERSAAVGVGVGSAAAATAKSEQRSASEFNSVKNVSSGGRVQRTKIKHGERAASVEAVKQKTRKTQKTSKAE